MADQPRALSEPWYRAVAIDHWVHGALPADQWLGVIDLIHRGEAEVAQARQGAGFLTRHFHKAGLPPEPPFAWTFEVVPLLRVLAEDAKQGAPVELRADLRGPKTEGKVASAGRLAGAGRVRHIDQTVYVDPWLSLAARLEDGTRATVDVTDRVRHRKVHKRSASGKYKTKQKEKWARRIDVEVAGQPEEHDLVVPTPPPRIAVYSKPGASRPTATARFDHLLPPPGGDGARLVVNVLAEAHRHLHPRSRGAA